MSFASYHHGTRLAESTETPVLVQIAQSAVVGLLGTAPDADATKFPLNVPVLLPGSPAAAAALGAAGTLKDAADDVFDQIGAYVVVIRVEEGLDEAATKSNLVGDAATLTGVHALKKAEAILGIKPRLIAIPGFSAPADAATLNPVVAELKGVLEALEAVAWVDGPDTTDAEAVSYEALIGSGRVKVVDPKVLVWDTTSNAYVSRPASARFAGVQARVDIERGFWHSESNKPINGIGGVSRTITYGAQSNLLNENRVATIINLGSGFITWGNRASAGDALWAFLSVRRTADFINDALRRAYLPFVDRPFSAANVKFMLESGNAAMRQFGPKGLGAIIGGRVWLDPDKNLPQDMAAGKITLSVEFEPPAPMEDIRFITHRNIQYYLDLTQAALSAAA
ncbi:phage tail sheath subtilisin-like domain-containing protein [Pararhodobacter sp. CCB-MM2]|uniref:phage tail sheath subtilisin-like domain-containing protein n=1 Tax=Pararhodobacter sp. CCB-MM2 TaxID=1786003 RepID=UPI000836AAEC|nr:phage tail sheath subtilisin-like domain-containing protein [Pararhodobacter sp. CCB-MM2]